MMGTPSTIRSAFVPYRNSEIERLAASVRKLVCMNSTTTTIEHIAENEGIFLRFIPDSDTFKEGFCCLLPTDSPKAVESIARPGERIFSFAERSKKMIPVIIINPLQARHVQEVFWHEYYHLFYSPNRKGGATFFGGAATAGVLDSQEERRADLFASLVLIPNIEKTDTISTISERYNVSKRLAAIRLRYQQHVDANFERQNSRAGAR